MIPKNFRALDVHPDHENVVAAIGGIHGAGSAAGHLCTAAGKYGAFPHPVHLDLRGGAHCKSRAKRKRNRRSVNAS